MRKMLLAVVSALAVSGCLPPDVLPEDLVREYEVRPVRLVTGDAISDVYDESAGQMLCQAVRWEDLLGPVRAVATEIGTCELVGGGRRTMVWINPELGRGAAALDASVSPEDVALRARVLAALRPVLAAPTDLTGVDVLDMPKAARTARLCEVVNGVPHEDKCTVGGNEVALEQVPDVAETYRHKVGGRPARTSGDAIFVRLRPNIEIDLRVSGSGAVELAERAVPKLIRPWVFSPPCGGTSWSCSWWVLWWGVPPLVMSR